MMNSETNSARKTIKMTIKKTCIRPPTTKQKQQNEFHSTNNGILTKVQRTIKTSLKQRHYPDRCVINLSKHPFS